MSGPAWLQLAAFFAVLLLAAWPLGRWMARLMGEALPRPLATVERALTALTGADGREGMDWKRYAVALLIFNSLGVVVVFSLQLLQAHLPLNPQGLGAVSADSALNTAISFASNTNWQGYAGESTMSAFTQMLALTVQNFLSAATGVAVAFALIRGLAARSAASIGNFWVDVGRVTLFVLLPLSLLYALFLVSHGVIQNLAPTLTITPLEPGAAAQSIAMGPVASQEAIKMLGTNGGGFFNANSAHPFENPTPLTNFVQMLSIFLVPAALCFTFGRHVGDRRQGVALLAAMTAIFLAFVVLLTAQEQQGNPLLTALGTDATASAWQAGGNMEGKEVRFGILASSLFAAVTTAASCGAVVAMHDSLTPLGGLATLALMQFGEVVFGGVGSGLYGMLVFAVLAVFIAGLMIGRTPEYLGKKIEPFEMKMASIAILVTPLLALGGTAVAVSVDAGTAGIANPGAHGFSEVLYAFTSAANNNGSAFAGLSANTPFYNLMLALAMALGRYAVIVPVLALAGSLAAKPRLPVTPGTLPTHGPLFVGLLVATVVLVGLLNYVPALALGPIVEHLVLAASAPVSAAP